MYRDRSLHLVLCSSESNILRALLKYRQDLTISMMLISSLSFSRAIYMAYYLLDNFLLKQQQNKCLKLGVLLSWKYSDFLKYDVSFAT